MKTYLLAALMVSMTIQAAPQPGKTADDLDERPVVGTVIGANPRTSVITIRESDLLGRLRLRLRSYKVKQTMLLNELQTGDKITAVFSARDGLLHRLRRVERFKASLLAPAH